MTDPRRPSADEVRALVARIVDQTLESDTADAAPSDGRTVVAIAGDHGGWRLKDAIGVDPSTKFSWRPKMPSMVGPVLAEPSTEWHCWQPRT